MEKNPRPSAGALEVSWAAPLAVISVSRPRQMVPVTRSPSSS